LVRINTGNALLVTGKTASGDPQGVAPDMAKSIADKLGVAIQYVPFAKPGVLADAVDDGVWDICLIGAEPARAERIDFTAAYAEIVATYMVAADSALRSVADVDRPGTKVIVKSRTAYDLWLIRNLKHAELLHAENVDEAFERFVNEKLDALAGLHERLLLDVTKMPGARILEGKFTSVQQAVGTQKKNQAALQFLRDHVEETKASGLVAKFIERHDVSGLSVAALSKA